MLLLGPFWLLFWLALTGGTSCVDVHFENKDGGFFLKHSSRQNLQSSDSGASSGSLLSVDRFAVFQTSQPISIRATYGPFSTKQTVPARYVVADPLPINTTSSSLDIQEFTGHHFDMSAHIVKNEIPRDSPVLRVLFHTGTDPGVRQPVFTHHQQKLCIILHATWGSKGPLSATCSPDGEDGVCLAQITVPSSWWPSLPPPDKDGRPGKVAKSPPRVVQVAYSVLEPHPDDEQGCQPKVQFQPTTILGLVTLVPAKTAYKELKLTEGITMLIPHPALFPLSRIHIPVFIEKEKAKLLTAIVTRGRVKNGVRFINATPSEAASSWNISVEMNPRHTGLTVSAVRKESSTSTSETATETNAAAEVIELFTLLVEISEDAAEGYDGAKVVWSTRVEPSAEESDIPDSHRADGRKTTTKFEIQKDDIQAVVPISKNWEVLNTAVLTGRQVSQAMKVLIVSQAGKAADVTFQASCHSEDDSVLKVSSSCSSVYVDGSEARGSVNGSVLVKYGTYTGLARFTVWMPEFPLDLQVPDTRLSQVKSWRVPDFHNSGKSRRRRKKRSYTNWGATGYSPDDIGNGIDRASCRLRYQQSPVDVFAHFMASDHDTGRITYLVNRRTWLRVTDLVLPLLRVSDPRIASLHGRILQGRSMGRTEVQVLSPITGRVIGAKEIRVGNDKVGISKLAVQVVSGLQLSITPDTSVENSYMAETSVTRKLTAQYQEGLLDIEIEFSDGSKTPLREVADTDYHLVVESLDPEVVAFAPMVASHHPRVIAVGEGSGDLLQVTLLLSEECRTFSRPKHKGIGPLATATASVTVDFSVGDLPHRPDILQNDGGSYGNSKVRDFTDLRDILKGPPVKDDNSHQPNVQARQHKGSHHTASHMTPLEISMYVLLAAFCFAIVIFVASCVVYASKFKPVESSLGGLNPMPIPTGNFRERKPRETTTNAHDWVWLGRSTMDMNSNRSSAVINNNEMRITANPLNLNYCEPDDCVPSSFSNPTHIELPSRSAAENQNQQVDSTTYCKSKRSGLIFSSSTTSNDNEPNVWNKPTPPPPLPPHGSPLLAAERLKEQQQQQEANGNEDYRPPIPPHRNVCISARNTSIVESSPPRKHHHHHRNSRHQQDRDKDKDSKYYNNNHSRESRYQNDNAKREPRAHSVENRYYQKKDEASGVSEKKPFRRSYHDDYFNKELKTNAFEFDDMPPESESRGKKEQQDLLKVEGGDDNAQFVSQLNGNNSSEVKRATIVGNPMFSAEDLNKEEINTELSGLEELGMDYEQIMHYFKNLKESNA
ncbi:transmembrane protein 132E isoform X2 [Agrilus planipennis]|uniref:Transmembrane protein 132E isoform X2 n=1 Tax=Agrilus planipennis TaxID=224129 RepID=A0A7F5RCW2_AGRPL|nr:transmembrane protein 132E isoform X2 [Agrilus planipennis]